MKRLFSAMTLLVILAMVLAACQPAPAQPEAAEQEPAAEATEAPAVEAPSKVKIAFFATGPLDEPWSQAMVQAVERVKAAKPSGLDIEYKWFEKVPIDDYEKFVRDVIETKEYDIIWLHDASAGTDPVDNLRNQYPEQLFGVSASNYHPVGGNTYFTQMYAHEPAYLSGVIAGLMTETNILGMVAGFPYASVNHLLNAFMDGAKSVNPDVKFKNSYIESWWDPVKAKETALAQIEAGADLIFSERYGGFEAARDKGKLAFGNQSDIHDMAPETIITSPLVFWDPNVAYVINTWFDHMTNGTPYNAPADKPIFFLMKDGGSDLAPLYEFENTLPKEVLEKYMAVKQQILDGTLEIPLNLEEVKTE
jgi:basic membrane lipoprotein Med (substrate-binding protein (PBP1-ABC) superfamily)